MNNLKRILSLALASVMLVGMMVVGASATDYPDDDKIVNKEAVDTLAALGIMNGDERGFRPEDGLTRAEAAKMLAKIHNKGKDVNFGVKETPTFTDIKGHWAEGNIEYAAAFGIANGRGNGIFDPQGQLKVVELVRMTLNMMGYDEGKTGSDWEIQTTVLANDLGLFDGLETFDPSAKVTRDQTAQILVNAIGKPMKGASVVTTYVYDLIKNADDSNLGTFDSAAEASGFAQGNGLAVGAYTINRRSVDKTESLGSKYLSITEDAGVLRSVSLIASGNDKGKYNTVVANIGTFVTATDYSKYIGEEVQVLYKGGNKKAVYGAFPISTIVYEGTVGEYQGIVAADSRNGAAIQALDIYNQEGTKLTEKLPAANKAFKVKAIATTNSTNGVVDNITVEEAVFGKVSFVGSTTINIANAGTLTLKDIKLYEGAKVGDYAIVTATANGTVVTKAEVVTGTIESRNNSGSVRVAGTWYPAGAEALTNDEIGEDYDLVLVNGYYVVATEAQTGEAASTDLFYLLKIADGATSLDGTEKLARVLGLDGKTLDIKLNTSDAGTAALVEGTSTSKFYTYKQESNGTYTLKVVDATNKAGYNDFNGNVNAGVTGAADGKPAKVGTLNLADDALVLVAYKTATNADKYETLTGKDVKSWNTNWGTAASTVAFFNNVNGISYVKLLFLASDAKKLPGAAAIDNGGYGYVVSKETTFELVNKETVAVYTIWNGKENVTVKDTRKTAVDAGDVIEYVENADGTITSTPVDTKIGAVTGWSSADKLVNIINEDTGVKDNDVAKLNDQTVILYVDTAKKTGAEGGAAEPMATKLDNGAYVPNVYYVTDSTTGTLQLLIVDTTNKIAGTTSTALSYAMIKALGEGVYTSKQIGNVTEDISSVNVNELIFVVYKAKVGTTNGATLKLYKAGDADKADLMNATENWTPGTADTEETLHVFVIDGCGKTNIGHNSVTKEKLEAGTQYVFEISGEGFETIEKTFTR